MMFEVSFSDGSKVYLQAHNRAQLDEALKNIIFTKAPTGEGNKKPDTNQENKREEQQPK